MKREALCTDTNLEVRMSGFFVLFRHQCSWTYCVDSTKSEDPEYICLKVGHTADLNVRMRTWQKQCSTKEQSLRGYWPDRLGETPEGGEATSITPGRKGPMCQRVERLTHLELADLVVNRQYLDADYKLAQWAGEDSITSSGSPKINPKGTAGKKLFPVQQCSDCNYFY